MKIINYDITRGNRLFLGQQFDHNTFKIHFDGFERTYNTSDSKIYLKWLGVNTDYLIELDEFDLEVTRALLAEYGNFLGQLVEIHVNGTYVKHSKVFKIQIAESIEGADSANPKELQKLNSLYTKTKQLYDDLEEKRANNYWASSSSNTPDPSESESIIKKVSQFTSEWLSDSTVYPADTLLIYSDYTTIGKSDGTTEVVPAFKLADGTHIANDLPFTSAENVIKLRHSITIGAYIFDGSEDVVIPVYAGESEVS